MTRRGAAIRLAACAVFFGSLAATSPALRAEEPPPTKMTKCEMSFTLKGWSAFYKTAEGEGQITCDNGEKANVRISTKGGGLTAGRSEIIDGYGKFTEVKSLDDLIGSYASAEAHAGAGKSATAQIVTKGEISLAISGRGTGIDLGISFGKFTIERAK